MEWEDTAGRWLVYLILSVLTFLALTGCIRLIMALVFYGQERTARLDCAKSGGRIEYSPEPHQSDWRCVMPVERGL